MGQTNRAGYRRIEITEETTMNNQNRNQNTKQNNQSQNTKENRNEQSKNCR